MATDKKSKIWIPWVIAAVAVVINLFGSAVGYGGDKQTIKDTAIELQKHCEKQECKEKETDTVLQEIKTQNAVIQSQNVMVLESVTALREELKELRRLR